jgi:hypothetical protein
VGARAKFWHCAKKCWHAGAHAKFSIARCRLSDTCVILAHSVPTHNKVHVVCTHIIMVCEVCAILVECKGILLVHAQCGYMLSRNNLINGARRVVVRDGGVLNFVMV